MVEKKSITTRLFGTKVPRILPKIKEKKTTPNVLIPGLLIIKKIFKYSVNF